MEAEDDSNIEIEVVEWEGDYILEEVVVVSEKAEDAVITHTDTPTLGVNVNSPSSSNSSSNSSAQAIGVALPSLSSSNSSSSSSAQTIGEASPNNNTPRRRSRKRNPHEWQQNIQHRLRMSGRGYLNRRGESRPAKEPRIMENCGCRFQCHKKLSPKRQEAICRDFFSLGDTGQQKAFLNSCIVERDVSRQRSQKGKTKFIFCYFTF